MNSLDHIHEPGETADIEDLPLKFEDIVDEKTYDKMRPPKPGGLTQMNLIDEKLDWALF